MKFKEIIFFYPSFEKGGVEKILIILIKYFLKKKIKITLISSKINKKINHKNFNHYILNKYKNRFHSAYHAMICLKEILSKQKKIIELKILLFFLFKVILLQLF